MDRRDYLNILLGGLFGVCTVAGIDSYQAGRIGLLRLIVGLGLTFIWAFAGLSMVNFSRRTTP